MNTSQVFASWCIGVSYCHGGGWAIRREQEWASGECAVLLGDSPCGPEYERVKTLWSPHVANS